MIGSHLGRCLASASARSRPLLSHPSLFASMSTSADQTSSSSTTPPTPTPLSRDVDLNSTPELVEASPQSETAGLSPPESASERLRDREIAKPVYARLGHGSLRALESRRPAPLCSSLQSIMRSHPGYKSIMLPSKLLTDALMVLLNSTGGPLKRRDRAEMIERSTTEYKMSRATLLQGVLRHGHRLISLGEIEQAIGHSNSFVWKTVHGLLRKYKTPGIETLTEEEVAVALFKRLPSFGERNAWELAMKGCRTLEDLLAPDEDGAERVKPKVRNYIKLLEVLDRSIPRSEVDEFKAELEATFKNASPQFRFQIVGSYRRQERTSSEIKVLVYNSRFERYGQEQGELFQELWRQLSDRGIFKLENMLEGGPNSPPEHLRLAGLASLGEGRPLRHLDIRLVPTDSLPYRLFWDTGSDWLVRHMVQEAERRKLHLWPGGMYPGPETRDPQTQILVTSERELFELLDVPYLELEDRGPGSANTVLPKLRGWSSATKPAPDFLKQIYKRFPALQSEPRLYLDKNDRPKLVASTRLPLPLHREIAPVPAFPSSRDKESWPMEEEEIQARAEASLRTRGTLTGSEFRALDEATKA